MPGNSSIETILNSTTDAGRVLVILFIPSSDKDGKPLPRGEDQELWANAAGQLLSKLFGGATEMPPAKGMWLNPESGETIIEDVILVHSYARRQDIEDDARIKELAVFLHRMGRKTKQGEVALVIDNIFHRIHKFTLEGGGR